MLMARMAEDSESATNISTLVLEMTPRERPEGWAHSQSFRSYLWLRFPSLPLPLKLKQRFYHRRLAVVVLTVLRFRAHI